MVAIFKYRFAAFSPFLMAHRHPYSAAISASDLGRQSCSMGTPDSSDNFRALE